MGGAAPPGRRLMGPRQLAGAAFRRVLPRTVEALETVRVLAGEVAEVRVQLEELRRRTDQLTARVEETAAAAASVRTDLDDARVRGGVADDAIARLVGRTDELDARIADVDAGLGESRRLSLRVAQMTDLVFDRLVASPPPAAD